LPILWSVKNTYFFLLNRWYWTPAYFTC